MKLNPFLFRKNTRNNKIFISNQLGGWSFLRNEADLYTLIAAPSESIDAERLQSKGFLSGDGESDLYERAAESKITQRFSRLCGKPSLVMVVPTLRCDHTCKYCQVSRAPISSAAHDIQLSPQEVANFITRTAAKRFKLEVQGGESLLALEFIYKLVGLLREMREISFEVVLCTALGPAIDDVFIDWCREESVQLSVSFDGFLDLHSKLRIHSENGDSASRFLEQRRKLEDASLSERISYVSTLTREALQRGPRAYIDACLSVGITRIYTRELSEYGFASTTKSNLGYSLEDYINFMERYLDELIAMHNRNEDFFDYTFSLYLTKLFSPNASGHMDTMSPAGYATSGFLLNYDGRVFGSDEARMLYESTKNERLTIGRLTNSGFELAEDVFHRRLLAESFLETSSICSTCAYLPFCGLDPIATLNQQGDLVGFKKELSQCKLTIGMLDLITERYESGQLTNEMVSSWM